MMAYHHRKSLYNALCVCVYPFCSLLLSTPTIHHSLPSLGVSL